MGFCILRHGPNLLQPPVLTTRSGEVRIGRQVPRRSPQATGPVLEDGSCESPVRTGPPYLVDRRQGGLAHPGTHNGEGPAHLHRHPLLAGQGATATGEGEQLPGTPSLAQRLEDADACPDPGVMRHSPHGLVVSRLVSGPGGPEGHHRLRGPPRSRIRELPPPPVAALGQPGGLPPTTDRQGLPEVLAGALCGGGSSGRPTGGGG